MFEANTLGSLITSALFKVPSGSTQRFPILSKYGKLAHILILYFAPLVLYVPVGLIFHLVLFRDYAVTLDSLSNLEQLSMFSGFYCGAPVLYMIFAAIYHKVKQS